MENIAPPCMKAEFKVHLQLEAINLPPSPLSAIDPPDILASDSENEQFWRDISIRFSSRISPPNADLEDRNMHWVMREMPDNPTSLKKTDPPSPSDEDLEKKESSRVRR